MKKLIAAWLLPLLLLAGCAPQAETSVVQPDDTGSPVYTDWSKLTPYEGGSCILTDDKAPVEVLGMRVLDELIGDELNYYKDELRTGGLSALIGN